MSLSSNGRTVAIGIPGADHTRLFDYSVNENSWVQLGQNIDGEENYDLSGYSVSLSSDGRTVAVGSPASNLGSGSARVFIYKGSQNLWIQLGQNISPED